MALSRISHSRDVAIILSRFNQVNGCLGDAFQSRRAVVFGKVAKPETKASFHVSGVRRYPEAPRLPLPSNVSEIFGNEVGRFTPERARDIAAPVLFYLTDQGSRTIQTKGDFSGNCANWSPTRTSAGDNHVDSYDCFGAVSLSSSMQSNVPIPFCSNGKASHFNMPGGQWTNDSKYIAEDMQKSHYTSVKARELQKKRRSNGFLTNDVLTRLTPLPSSQSCVEFSTDSKTPVNELEKVYSNVAISKTEKLKRAVKGYGSVVIVFHVGISLISLGACYIAVSSGIDVIKFVEMIPNVNNEKVQSAIANSSTFVVAYSVHKLLAPVRISITLAVIPFVIRYWRRIRMLTIRKKV